MYYLLQLIENAKENIVSKIITFYLCLCENYILKYFRKAYNMFDKFIYCEKNMILVVQTSGCYFISFYSYSLDYSAYKFKYSYSITYYLVALPH